MLKDKNLYLLARDIIDWNDYTPDGKVRYFAKYINVKTGAIVWLDQSTNQVV